MNLTLRPCQSEDQDFLFRLYADTRAHEFAGLGWDRNQLDVFLRMQFNSQQRWYEMSYSGADHDIICADGETIGRIMVLRKPEQNLLVDIALLPERRNRGIGARLLEELIAESDQAGRPVSLQVLKTNPALHLYKRLGFVQTGEDQMYFQMERRRAATGC